MYRWITLEVWGAPLTLSTYKLFMILSMAAGLLLSCYALRKRGYILKDVLFLFVLIVLSFFIGARLLNVIINIGYYLKGERSVFALELSSLSLYGGIMLSAGVSFLVVKLLKKEPLRFYDAMVIPFLVSFAIMRMGCFLNGCCMGQYTESAIGIPAPSQLIDQTREFTKLVPFVSVPGDRVYPTQLMEAGFALFFIPIACILQKNATLKSGNLSIIAAMYFSTFRWFVLNYRLLPYPQFIISYGYPLLYLLILIMGLVLLIIRRSNFPAKKN